MSPAPANVCGAAGGRFVSGVGVPGGRTLVGGAVGRVGALSRPHCKAARDVISTPDRSITRRVGLVIKTSRWPRADLGGLKRRNGLGEQRREEGADVLVVVRGVEDVEHLDADVDGRESC